MKRITVFETSDKVLHKTEADARRHAEKRYGEQLSHMAHQIISLEKYTKIQEFIDVRLDVFETLKKMKEDISLDPFECSCEE